MATKDMLVALGEMDWKYKGRDLNSHNLAYLLENYTKPSKSGDVRGYYRNMFKNTWERDLGLDTSDASDVMRRIEGPERASGEDTPGSPLVS
jgi:hypothetical protein